MIEEVNSLHHPTNIDLPFFAYGIFKPGQLAFFQLKEMVKTTIEPATIRGQLLMRDGLLIMDLGQEGTVNGALLEFNPDMRHEAYERISLMEPDKQYRWEKAMVGQELANVLVGKSPRKGSVSYDEIDWNGWEDPLFTAALEVVEEIINSQDAKFDWNMKPLFRLQMAYLLLWSSIERYASLRYHLGTGKVSEKVEQIAKNEPAFAVSLQKHVIENRVLFRADSPNEKVELNPQKPVASIRYYYQVRSNITHRGKGIHSDFYILKDSITELLAIFCDVIKVAEQEARSAVSAPNRPSKILV